MAEPQEQQGYEPPLMVAVDHGRGLGHLLNKPGQSFRLQDIFSREADILGGDKFRQVYFRTESGNIYLLTEKGMLVNRNESLKQDRQVGYQMSEAEQRDMEKVNLTVGEGFRYGASGYTTRIIEIVPRTDRWYTEEYIRATTEGKTSNIVEDFQKGMPSPLPGHPRMV